MTTIRIPRLQPFYLRGGRYVYFKISFGAPFMDRDCVAIVQGPVPIGLQCDLQDSKTADKSINHLLFSEGTTESTQAIAFNAISPGL